MVGASQKRRIISRKRPGDCIEMFNKQAKRPKHAQFVVPAFSKSLHKVDVF